MKKSTIYDIKAGLMFALPGLLVFFLVVIIPFVLRYGYGLAMEVGGHDLAIPFYMLTVGAGEVICCCILGSILLNALAKVRNVIFKNE